MQSAVKVGGLVVVFGGLALATAFSLGNNVFAPKQKTYFARFADANGVTSGTRILLAGVKVGKVTDVQLESPTSALLTLEIEPAVTVPEGTRAISPSSLIGFGDNPIFLRPPQAVTPALPEKSILKGEKAGALENVVPESTQLLAEMSGILKEVRKLVSDQKTKDEIRGLLANSQTTIAAFGKLANNLDRVVVQSQGQIQLALVRGTAAIADVQKMTSAIAKLLNEGSLQRDSKAILASLSATAKKADALVANMNALVADPKLKTAIGNLADMTETGKTIAANVSDLTESGKKIATNTEAITKNGITISENIADLTERSKKVIDGAADLEKDLSELIKKVGGVLGGGKGPKVPPIQTSMDLLHVSKPDRTRTDFNARIQLKDGFFDLGLYDAFESNRMTAQFGQNVSPSFTSRYGVFGGKAGVGVDYKLGSKFSLRTDLWDLNDPRFDTRLRLDFGKGLYGWAGVDRLFSKNAPTFGIGFSR